MVARLNYTAKLDSILDYNEQKVARNEARLIHANGFLQHPERLSSEEKTERFALLNERNSRSRVNMLHATLNFDLSDALSVADYAAIADRYMRALGMANQPYLVYQHLDAGHPHLHIVSSLIQADGRRIRTHNMGRNLSEPARLAIEQEFGLAPANHRQKHQTLPDPGDPPTRIRYGKDGAHHPEMARVIDYTLKHYNMTTLAEFNAVLRGYNLTADPGGPHSRTRKHDGLTYRITDDQGRKRSAPVKASDFPSQPTVARLEKIFIQNRMLSATQIQPLEQRLARVFAQAADSLPGLSNELEAAGIDLVLHQNREGGIRNVVYIDQDTRLAVDGLRLSRDFLGGFLGDNYARQQGEQLSLFPPPNLAPIPGFSTQSPQLLSQLVRHSSFDPPEDLDQSLEQSPRPRPRH